MKPIWYWLFPLCIIALALYVCHRNWPWWNEDDRLEIDRPDMWAGFAIGTLLTVGLCILSLLGAYGLSSFISDHTTQVWHQDWKAPMVSLRSADGEQGKITGGIFILSGYINAQQTYFYYTKREDGSFAPHRWVPDSNTSIFEGKREDGEVVQFDCVFKHSWLSWFADPWDQLKMNFYIPIGSVRQGFSVQ